MKKYIFVRLVGLVLVIILMAPSSEVWAINCVPPRPFSIQVPAGAVIFRNLPSEVNPFAFDAAVWRYSCPNGQFQVMLTITPYGPTNVSGGLWYITQPPFGESRAVIYGEQSGNIVTIDGGAINGLPKSYLLESELSGFDAAAEFRLRYVSVNPNSYLVIPALGAPAVSAVLQNGVRVPGVTQSVSDNEDYRDYSVVVPVGARNLRIETLGATADVDLYVRFGSVPSLSAYDCRPYLNGGNEACVSDPPAPGTYFIRVYGFSRGIVHFDVKASWEGGTDRLLAVVRLGSGTGTVTSSPSGINCGSNCTARFASDSLVNLVAIPSPGSDFIGWSGACVGLASCNVVMSEAREVIAVFQTRAGSVGVDEPGLAAYPLPSPIPPNQNCPAGFFAAIVEDGPGPGIYPGTWGMEVVLDGVGQRTLSGGLNFGGLIDVTQPGFAGVNIANPANEPQRLNIILTGSSGLSAATDLPVRLRIERSQAGAPNTVVFDSTVSLSMSAAYQNSIVVGPGFHTAIITPLNGTPGGAPDGQFYFSLTTSFVDRVGGGFQGGAVIGGYHGVHPFGGVSGFAAFCIAQSYSTSIRTLSAPSYGSIGARDLRMRLINDQQQTLISVPALR